MSYDAETYRELLALAGSAAAGDDVPLPQDRAPPAVHPATEGTKRIVLWSKWHSARRFLGLPAAPRTTTVVHLFDVPQAAHVRALRELQQRHACPVAFVGDLDPHDLTMYWFLRAGGEAGASSQEPAFDVQYLGVDSRWLAFCRAHLVGRADGTPGVEDRVTIMLGAFERRLLAWLSARMELGALLGDYALGLLLGGRKLELEGATNPAFYDAAFAEALRRSLFGEDL